MEEDAGLIRLLRLEEMAGPNTGRGRAGLSNEVEIVVSSRDRTGPGLAAARGKASAFAASTKATLGKAGVEAGQALGDGIVRGAGARLRDSRGRFVRGGQDLGDGIAEGIESGTRRGDQIVGGFTSSVLSSFRKLGPGMGAAVTAGLYGAAAVRAPRRARSRWRSAARSRPSGPSRLPSR
ncbi:hypothetical protein ACFQ0B_17575 [Nonomuraea thailandensis]